ncbi:hypothetical protein CTA2_7940 [Colletotrichum tanaceti]|uniref:Uncharacterized protein n=1 Tax=Colletotrichum tanaceti TaxID=1306861 RepID=A0A4U6XHP7_9PEZI|nr:hypothetical protein CTA2_7940 [Colletotrichum tanaceti]TKW55164.1 hypothetical protein CTA1_11983 [Colletotrichum tanaceti]
MGNPSIGLGGPSSREPAHFRVYVSAADRAKPLLIGAYACFIDGLGWRFTGLTYNDESKADGPRTKLNFYSVARLPDSAGVMRSDTATGMAWLEIANSHLVTPVTVHEFGRGPLACTTTSRHGCTRAGPVSDTFLTSPLCAAARSANGQATPSTSNTNVVKITTIGQLTSRLVVRNIGSGALRHVELVNGAESVSATGGEEASLVVVNTLANLVMFDPFAFSAEVNARVDYSFTFSGATA